MGKQLSIAWKDLSKVMYELWKKEEDSIFFDYDTYGFYSKEDLQEGSYYIPLVHEPEVVAMKEYIKSLNDKSIIKVFKELSDKEIWGNFWNYFDDDGEKSYMWHQYKDKYCLDLMTKWCDENGISYRLSDDFKG